MARLDLRFPTFRFGGSPDDEGLQDESLEDCTPGISPNLPSRLLSYSLASRSSFQNGGDSILTKKGETSYSGSDDNFSAEDQGSTQNLEAPETLSMIVLRCVDVTSDNVVVEPKSTETGVVPTGETCPGSPCLEMPERLPLHMIDSRNQPALHLASQVVLPHAAEEDNEGECVEPTCADHDYGVEPSHGMDGADEWSQPSSRAQTLSELLSQSRSTQIRREPRPKVLNSPERSVSKKSRVFRLPESKPNSDVLSKHDLETGTAITGRAHAEAGMRSTESGTLLRTVTMPSSSTKRITSTSITKSTSKQGRQLNMLTFVAKPKSTHQATEERWLPRLKKPQA